MTITEKLEMYKEKKDFIGEVNKAFRTFPKGSTVASVAYEVYRKDVKETTYFIEYLVVTFFGGAKSVRVANGNSNTANFRTLGSMIEGGYYDEVQSYETLAERGYELVQFNCKKTTLADMLNQPMKHISDVHRCFEYCASEEDVEKVIKMIPSVFGTFEAEFFDEESGSFRITNTYEDGGCLETEETDFDLCMDEYPFK